MITGHYILHDHTPVPEPDTLTWARWFSTAERRVAYTEFTNEVSVSTVFLGLDHNFFGCPPLLFETMIFGADEDYQERYATWDAAAAGHAAVVAWLVEDGLVLKDS